MDQNSGLYWQQPTIVNNQISFPKEESLKAKGPNISYIPYSLLQWHIFDKEFLIAVSNP